MYPGIIYAKYYFLSLERNNGKGRYGIINNRAAAHRAQISPIRIKRVKEKCNAQRKMRKSNKKIRQGRII